MVPTRPARRAGRPATGWSAWLGDPRSAVLFFLTSALIFGGGRKLLQAARARRAIAALGEPEPGVVEIEAAADHGRAGLIDLFRLLGTAEKPEVRDAAGRALSRLWAGDELIVEEEKALVRRGFAVTWRARRRYPRGLRVPFPVEASYGVPFLERDGPGVSPTSLEWSHRILGAERARLEQPSPWKAGTGSATFEVDPGDFPANGPYRVALAAKVRVVGLTDAWELELPHIPFSFEFDPILGVDALLTSPDDARADVFARSLRLEAARPSDDREPEPPEVPTMHDPDLDAAVGPPEKSKPADDQPRFLELSSDLVLRDPPDLVATTPLPCDLAHTMAVEFEGVPGLFRAGSVVISDRGSSSDRGTQGFPIGPILELPPGAIDRPGDRRMRVVLTADPDLGWADPDVRSIWPGELMTEWATVRVIRK